MKNKKEYKTKGEYLYGEYTPDRIPKEIIGIRLEKLNKNLYDQLNVDYRERDSERVNNIVNAISFWTKFLNKEEI
jgi:hypothetical protein